MRLRSAYFLPWILTTQSSAQITSELDAADNPFAAYTSQEDDLLTVTMFPSMQPFSLSTNTELDFSLSIDEILVYENITSLNIEKGHTIRGVFVSYCTLLPDVPSMLLEVTGYKNEIVSPDLELVPVPKSFMPAKYADYNCLTSLYRGNKRVRLPSNQFIEGVLLFQPERWDYTSDIKGMTALITIFIVV